MSVVDKDSELVQVQARKILGGHRVWLRENSRTGSAWEILKADTLVFDRVLALAFPVFGVGMTDRIALVALGSYGRGEVCPHSDLDLLILHRDLPLRKLEDFSGRLLGLLWDQKIQVGHGIRTIEQCLKLSEKDYAVLTSVLDGRLVAGSGELFRDLAQGVEKLAGGHKREYFSVKLEERRKRQLKFGDAVWMNEPHLMEGTGGLRDWHLVEWFSRFCLGLPAEEGLLKSGLATRSELKKLRDGRSRMLRARIGLHLMTGEKTDQARLEYQKGLSEFLGVKPRSGRAEEDALLEYVLTGAELAEETLERMIRKLKRDFKLDDQSGAGEGKKPLPGSTGAKPASGPGTISPRELGDSPLLIGLKKSGELKSFLPELDQAFYLGQRDAYHIYTVGWHSLRCLIRIEEMEKTPEFGEDPEINWTILKLAGLIHDLGKGTGSDHLKTGGELARRIGRRFHLKAETGLLEFLVSEHMLLNHYAQRRDFYERKASAHLIRKIKDSSRLKMLYLLTCADIQAVSAKSWTSWKAELLRSLYHWLLLQMEKRETPRFLIQKRIQVIRDLMDGSEIDRKLIRELEKLPTRYLLGSRPEKLIGQLRLVEGRGEGESIIQAQKLEKPRLELSVIGDDRPGLFSELAGVLSALNYNILSAQINTLKQNTVLDMFLVEDLVARRAEQWPLDTESRIETLRKTLVLAMEKKIFATDLLRKKKGIFKPRPQFRICAEVQADQDSSDDYTIVEVQARDRTGLLYKITRAIFEQGLDIHFAKVSTRAEKVFDVFYLLDSATKEKAGMEKISTLLHALSGCLEEKIETGD